MKKRLAVVFAFFAIFVLFVANSAAQEGLVTKANDTQTVIARGEVSPFTPLGGGCSTASATGIGATIPDDGYDGTLASMTCQDFDTSGDTPGAIESVEVSVGVNHTWVGDLTIKVVSPAGTEVTVLQRPAGDGTNPTGDTGDDGCCGDSSDWDGTPVTFSMASANDAETMGMGISGTEFVCTTDGVCDYLPNADFAAAGDLDTFAGELNTGTWSICVSDSEFLDSGSLESAAINMTCTEPTDVALTGFDSNSNNSLLPLLALFSLTVAAAAFVIMRRREVA